MERRQAAVIAVLIVILLCVIDISVYKAIESPWPWNNRPEIAEQQISCKGMELFGPCLDESALPAFAPQRRDNIMRVARLIRDFLDHHQAIWMTPLLTGGSAGCLLVLRLALELGGWIH